MLRQEVRQLFRLHSFPFHLATACGVGLLLGIACLWFSPLGILVALAGGLTMIGAAKRPDVALLGILIATSSIIFENRLPLIPIGIGSLHIPDFILLELLAVIIVRGLVASDFKIIRTSLDWPLLAFYVVALFSTFMAISQSSLAFEQGIRSVRTVTYYLTFFVVTNLVREQRQLRSLMRGLILLATVVAVAMIAQFLLGESLALFPGRVETLYTQGTRYAGITRVLPPGQSLIMVAFTAITATLALASFRPASILRFLHWCLLGLAVVLTFNRSFWAGIMLGLFLLACLIRGQERQRFLGWSLVVLFLAALILLPALESSESRVGRLARAALERLGTLAGYEGLATESSQFRSIENQYAVLQIAAHPLIGLGLGARYRPWDARLDWQGRGDRGFDGRAYIHNGHLWILLQTGLTGYLCLMWLSLAFLARGFRYWRQIPDPQMKGTVLGFTLTYVGVLVGAVVNPMFMQWFWTPVIGIMMGINEVILKQVVRQGSPSNGGADVRL